MARLGQKNMWIGQPAHARLLAVRDRMERDKGRTVTMSEVIEYLLDVHDLEVRA